MCVCLPASDRAERRVEPQTENDRGNRNQGLIPTLSEFEESQFPVRKPFWLSLPKQYCIPLGASALGMVVVENTALMDRSTQAWTVKLYSLFDLKYSSHHSSLSINIYFNQCYTQSAHGVLGMYVTFPVQ